MRSKACKRCNMAGDKSSSPSRSQIFGVGPVAVIMMTGPSGKRVAVIAACASPLIHWPFEVASVTIELFENFMLKGLLAC